MDNIYLKIDQKLAQEIFNYLVKRPAKDVFTFLLELKQLQKCECEANKTESPKLVK